MQQNSIKIGPYINWAESQYIPSHKISYLEFGNPNNENIIICAHGLTRNAHDFDKIAGILSNNFRVISINYPGRGDSEYFKNKSHYNYQVYIKDTVLFLKQLKLKSVVWLGTSMGGIIGMIIASKYHGLIKALIINDVGPYIDAAPLVKIGRYASKSPLFDNLSQAKEHLKLIYSQFGISNEEDWDHLTKYSFVQKPNNQYQMNYDPLIAFSLKTNPAKLKDVDLWSFWHKIHCKILVIHGVLSEILTQNTIDQMKQSKTFDLFEVFYAGHAPSLMNDDQIQFVNQWLHTLSSSN